MKVIWSHRAEFEFTKICDYLVAEWNSNTALGFIDSVEKTIMQISTFPFLYPAFDKRKNIRKCVLNRYTILYYRVTKSCIELVTFFQTRQSPRKLKI